MTHTNMRKAHGCNPVGFQNDTTNDLDYPTGQRPDKGFETLRAVFALRGHALYRLEAKDGPATYWAERWGLVRHLPTIEDVQRFAEQIGGEL